MNPKLILVLKRCWFLAIGRGEKTVEYRRCGHYWGTRLRDLKPGDLIEFRLGYSKVNTIRAEFVMMDVGKCPYDGFTDDYFRIHFRVLQTGGFRK